MRRIPKSHWTPWLWSILCLWLFLSLLPAQASQQNAPDPPATYYGLLQAGSGFTPTSGMTVTAWISGTLCGKAPTQAVDEDVVYSINVEADWDAAPGCGAPGREIHFTVGDYPMQPLALWDNSQVHALDLFPGDIVAPQVTDVLPANGAIDVPRNTPIVVDFSEPMLTGSVSTLVTPTVGGLIAVWSNGDARLTLDHDDFAAGTRYTVTVAGSDMAGNPMASPYTWSFITGAEVAPEADLSLGKVCEGSGVVIAGERITYTFTITNSGPTSPVTATVVDLFSDAGPLAGISGAGCIWPGAETVTCTVTGVVTTTPTLLTLVVTTSATYSGTLSNSAVVAPTGDVVDPDASNNSAGPVSVSIQREPGDITPPTVVAVSPVHNATDVPRNAPVVVDFSEAMATGSVITLITPTVGGLVETWSNGDARLTLNHDNFDASTCYTVTVAGSDLAGNPMTSPYTWAFTTGAISAPEADLSLGKVREGSGVVTAGERITYTFTITNAGPTSPVTATLVDVFNDASALAGVSGPDCAWPGGATITCTVTGIVTSTPSLSTLLVTASATYSGTLINSATVTPIGNVVDPQAGNNSAGPVEVAIKTTPIDQKTHIYLPLVLRNLG
ncbi:MAG: Ig-like domain-containing protein [Anaerolineae bacterium]